MAFVASKKVGNAVKRAKAKRRLKALCTEYEKHIKAGKYILVAKEKLFKRNHLELKKDFIYAMKKLQLLEK